ncbi:hypothetical protein OPV22_007179 [Ensete ventricosum]|uniref:Uncharacterized protein n=1 Tax=Ensete ventricosum TaxID=4639 RepID=A0AAV8RU43_ENSVE|nr:hypothetical protein OPV22_007179 [Ensete ventricosum]
MDSGHLMTRRQMAANLFPSPPTFIIISGSGSSGKANNMIGRRDSTSLASCGRQLTPWSFASAGHMMCPGPAPATMNKSL